MSQLIGLAAIAVSGALSERVTEQHFNGDVYAATPAGWVLSHCVHDVPHGSSVTRTETETEVWMPAAGGKKTLVATFPKCEPLSNKSNPVLRRNSAPQPKPPSSSNAIRQLPADYDGWLQYTAYNNTPSVDVMTNLMSVPDVPKKVPQILYFFPGLQNINWIPKVDPEPSVFNPFDIIQPVLQYPGEQEGEWGVRSWYVTIHSGALRSDLVGVKPGDSIECNMTRTGEESWFIGAKLTSSGQETNQMVSSSDSGAKYRVKFQPWAYVTLECYGCDGCGTYPEKPIVFSDIKLAGPGGKPLTPLWQKNPKPQPHQMCQESTVVSTPELITISFQGQVPKKL